MKNKWLENLKDISEKRRVGKCPFCKGADTDYKCSVVDQENRLGYMDTWIYGAMIAKELFMFHECRYWKI